MEVSPGIHRIESDLGPRFMCQFLLSGDERSLLVDTGLADTPDAVIVPYLESIGMTGHDLSLVLVSHADVDHCGGNRAFQRRFGDVPFAAHPADHPWIASNAAMMDGNYLWYRDHGFGPEEDVAAWIREQLGGDSRVDDTVADGETLRLGADLSVEVLHLPGHTAGHVGLWDAEHRVALIVDAVLERGVRDRAGTLLIPPRIYDVAGYRTSIARLRALEPELLLTAHFPVMRGVEVDAFLAGSLAFVDEVETAVAEAGARGLTELWDVTRDVDARLGPYPEFMIELAASVRYFLGAGVPA
jgi:glyoxylase-like metal-dependent hydrolase (beta-lactamase superfamily II)